MSFWCHRFDQNSNKIIVRISDLKFFVASWGLPWTLFGLPGDLVSNIINKEAYRKPKKASRKPPGSYKKFQGRNPEIITVGILGENEFSWGHYKINLSLAISRTTTQIKLFKSNLDRAKHFVKINSFYELLFSLIWYYIKFWSKIWMKQKTCSD